MQQAEFVKALTDSFAYCDGGVITVYLRTKAIVPPSTERGMGMRGRGGR